MPRISSLGKVVLTVLSLATPACEGCHGANFDAGANFARAEARKIVEACTLPDQPVSDCIMKSGLSVSEVCAPLKKAEKPGCSEMFTQIKYTGKGL